MKLTIEFLEKKDVCTGGKKWFLEHNFTTVEETICQLMIENNFEWSNWLISKVLTTKNCVRYACHAAELVLPVFEAEFPDDKRPRNAIELVKKYLKNPKSVTVEELNPAAMTAWTAGAYAAGAAYWAAEDGDAAAWGAATAARAAYCAAEAADAARAAYDAAGYAVAAINANSNIKQTIINYGLELLKNDNT